MSEENRATHSARGIPLMGYKNIKSLCSAKWAKADPERRKRQQEEYYRKNADRIKERKRRLYKERKERLAKEKAAKVNV